MDFQASNLIFLCKHRRRP